MKTIISLVVLFTISVTAYSQKAKANSEKNKSTTVLATESYTCPMHPDVKSDKPGKCSKCGMDLLRSKKEQLKKEAVKSYTCPMHPEVISDKPGVCSKCGSKLLLSKKEQLKMEVTKNYTCPMHPDVTSNKAGKCPKCGMELKVMKSKTATNKG